MGREKQFRPQYIRGSVEAEKGLVENRIVTETTAANLEPYGLSIVTGSAAASKSYVLSAPTEVGVHKYVVVDTFPSSTQSFTVKILNETTSITLNGSSFSAVTLTTAALNRGGVHLIAETLSNWSVVGLPSAGASLSTQ